MDGGRAHRVEDLLSEPLLASLRDVYLNVEGVLRMTRADGSVSPSTVPSPTSPPTPISDELVSLIEQCLLMAGEPAGSGGTPLPSLSSPQHFFVFSELQRINRFVKQRVEREWSRLVHASQQLWGAVEECAMCPGTVASEQRVVQQHVARIRSMLDCARKNIEELDAFVRHNVVLGEYVARCLAGRPVSVTSKQEHNLYVVGIERVLMQGVMMSSVLMALSDLYEGVRVLEVHGRVAKKVLEGVMKAAWKAPSKFSRVVKKFWILPKDVMRFKLFVMQHLPILVYGERDKLLDGVRNVGGAGGDRGGGAHVRSPSSLRMEDFACEDAGEIASVYLDSVPSLQHYHDRLHRRDKAMVTRIRWYGARDPADGDKSIFVERKTHRNAYTGLASAKERGCIKQRDVNGFLRGDYMVAEGAKDAELLTGVMEEIRDEQQEILMRTTYSRTAFQNATENTVRISLDTNLCMTKEYGYQTAESWCRDMGSFPLREDDVAQFPYGVVEIKLQASPPQWVRDLVNSGMLLVVPKFSKFLHGTAVLYQQTTENVPYWFLPDPRDEELLTPATWDEMADKECIFSKDAADWLFPKGFELPANQERHLTLPFFRPKGSRLNSEGQAVHSGLQRPTTTDQMQDVSAREAMRELEDESGNRTWCDVETVESPVGQMGQGTTTVDIDMGEDNLSATQPLPTARKPSWTVYQSVGTPSSETENDTEHDGSSSGYDYGTSHTSGSDLAGSEHTGSESGVTVLPFERRQKQLASSPLSMQSMQQSMQPIHPSPYSMSGSFGVMQYSMSMGKGKDDSSAEDNPKVPRKRSASIVRTRVEPKTFFANERTFLQWINVSVLVMFLALSLLSGSVIPGMGSGLTSTCDADDAKCLAGKMSGAIIAPVALSFMGYALYMYKKRTLQILRRETVRYDDQRGPVVLVVILLLAMTISYILTMIFVF